MGFVEPTTKISTPEDLEAFHQSEVYTELITFLESLNTSVLNKKLSDSCPESPVGDNALTHLPSQTNY